MVKVYILCCALFSVVNLLFKLSYLLFKFVFGAPCGSYDLLCAVLCISCIKKKKKMWAYRPMLSLVKM